LTDEDRKKLELFDTAPAPVVTPDETLRPLPKFSGKWGPKQSLLGYGDSDDD
jgi:hypothetical protein